MRKVDSNVWINNCLGRIEEDDPPIAIISDCRFNNEIKAVQSNGGIVIRLTREGPEPLPQSCLDAELSNHVSETETDNYENYDYIIDNKNMSIKESCDAFLDILNDAGITKKLRTVNPRLGTASIK
jgi:hypothetical protein